MPESRSLIRVDPLSRRRIDHGASSPLAISVGRATGLTGPGRAGSKDGAGGAVLSIGFLLYQTSYIFKHSDMDDPVGDALGLLVQLRNLFMFILRILMSSRR